MCVCVLKTSKIIPEVWEKRKYEVCICNRWVTRGHTWFCHFLLISNQTCNCQEYLQNELRQCCPRDKRESMISSPSLDGAVPLEWVVVAPTRSNVRKWGSTACPGQELRLGEAWERWALVPFCWTLIPVVHVNEFLPSSWYFLMPISYVFLSTGRHQSCSTQKKNKRDRE